MKLINIFSPSQNTYSTNVSEITNKMLNNFDITQKDGIEKEVIELTKNLQKSNISLNQLDDNNFSLLHIAIFYKLENFVKFLLDNGADVNIKMKDNETEILAELGGFSPLDQVLYSMRDPSEYNRDLFIELMSHNALVNFRIIPNDIILLYINECKENAEIIEQNIFKNIFRNIREKSSDYNKNGNIQELMNKICVENIFLVQHNEINQLKEKISIFLKELNPNNKEKEELICIETNISEIKPITTSSNYEISYQKR